MNCVQVYVYSNQRIVCTLKIAGHTFKVPNNESLCCLLQSTERSRLESDVCHVILGYLASKAGKGQLGQEEVEVPLIPSDLSNRDRC